jgi:hypothetical protein
VNLLEEWSRMFEVGESEATMHETIDLDKMGLALDFGPCSDPAKPCNHRRQHRRHSLFGYTTYLRNPWTLVSPIFVVCPTRQATMLATRRRQIRGTGPALALPL